MTSHDTISFRELAAYSIKHGIECLKMELSNGEVLLLEKLDCDFQVATKWEAMVCPKGEHVFKKLKVFFLPRK